MYRREKEREREKKGERTCDHRKVSKRSGARSLPPKLGKSKPQSRACNTCWKVVKVHGD